MVGPSCVACAASARGNVEGAGTPYVKVGTESSADIEIHYNDHGAGKPTSYDYDTFTADLKALLDHLALDEDVVLAGFSIGTGEVARLRDEQLIADLTVVEVADGPHNIGWTHHEELNEALLAFLAG